MISYAFFGKYITSSLSKVALSLFNILIFVILTNKLGGINANLGCSCNGYISFSNAPRSVYPSNTAPSTK